MALGLPLICAEYGLETRLTRTEEIRLLVLDLRHIFTENGQEK